MITKSQVAKSTPLDNSLIAYNSEDVQDAFSEIRSNVVFDKTTTAAVNSQTLELFLESNSLQIITGSGITNYSVKLPDATTLFNGRRFEIVNLNTLDIAIKNFGDVILFLLPPGSVAQLTLESNSTSSGNWIQVVVSTVATGILNYKLTSSTPFTTTSTTDVPITGFSLTPSSGTYLALYNASVLYTTTPRNHWWSFYVNGVQVSASERNQLTSRSNEVMVDSLLSTFTVNGTESVDVRVRRDPASGSLTVNSRTIVLIRLGV